MKECCHCGKKVTSSHYCKVAERRIQYNDDFLISAAIGAVTDSAIVGTLLGGDIAGAIVGDIFNGFDLFD